MLMYVSIDPEVLGTVFIHNDRGHKTTCLRESFVMTLLHLFFGESYWSSLHANYEYHYYYCYYYYYYYYYYYCCYGSLLGFRLTAVWHNISNESRSRLAKMRCR